MEFGLYCSDSDANNDIDTYKYKYENNYRHADAHRHVHPLRHVHSDHHQHADSNTWPLFAAPSGGHPNQRPVRMHVWLFR